MDALPADIPNSHESGDNETSHFPDRVIVRFRGFDKYYGPPIDRADRGTIIALPNRW